MIKKVFKEVVNEFKTNYKIYIVYLILLLALFIPFDYYIYSSGGLVDLSDRIIVEDSYESKGSINLTYVSVRNANIYTILLSYIIPGWDLKPSESLKIDNESKKEILERDKIYLKETSYDAIISAFKEANLPYKILKNDVTITYVFDEADTDLEVGDIITKIDDKLIENVSDIASVLANHNENDSIKIDVIRNNKEKSCYAKVIVKDNKKVIGLLIANMKDVVSTPSVEYVFKDSESGSSRGLMCALDIYNKITEYDITKGDIISGTGSIDENGKVGSIDGVKYKLSGAVKNKASVFIVPSDNYKEALKEKEKNKYDIEIIEAGNLHELIEKLKNR